MRLTRIARISCLIAATTVVSVAGQQPPNTRIAVTPGSPTPNEPTGPAQVSDQDLRDGLKNPTRWLTYGGDYASKRYSPLTQLTPANVNRLTVQWTLQGDQPALFRGVGASPIALDGVLYFTGTYGRVVAIDARTGRQIWRTQRDLPGGGLANQRGENFPSFAHAFTRGSAIAGDKLIVGTSDSHLIALDTRTGAVVWDTVMDDYKKGFEGTSAPLVVGGNKIIVGTGGGDSPNRCFLDAYDLQTGKRLWRFYTIPEPGEPGSETWPNNPKVMFGGATWVNGSYDPETNLVYWGTGNGQGPGNGRPGDNLYTASLIALDADTGKLKWYYQVVPHDTRDLDACSVPVLADLVIDGQPRKVVLFAPKAGYLYVLDRVTGKFLKAHPLAEAAKNWATIDANGKPKITEDSTHCLPDGHGVTNFWPPSYDPAQGLVFITIHNNCNIADGLAPSLVPGAAPGTWTIGGTGYASLIAMDPITGTKKWEYKFPNGDFGQTGGVSQARPGYGLPNAGALTSTASGLIFSGDNEGDFVAFDSRTGKVLWHHQVGAPVWGSAPITYMLDGKQHVLIAAGLTLTDYAIPDAPRP